MPSEHATELATHRRFAFGANWQDFLSDVDEGRIQRAAQSLRDMLEVQDLRGKRLLDVGSGSGLFSLAARQLGAVVQSFDYDPASVACTRELKHRYQPDDTDWSIGQGSTLDKSYLSGLGRFDVVYAWGVLHHTGNMWRALDYVADTVCDRGLLFVVIYNDQGGASRRWLLVKKAYNRLPRGFRWLVVGPASVRLWWRQILGDLATGHPFRTWRDYKGQNVRGMSPWRDLIDWVGGLPFEVASPQQIFRFFRDRGFDLQELKTCNNLGCNEFVFRKSRSDTPTADRAVSDTAQVLDTA